VKEVRLQSGRARALIGAATIALIVVLFIVLSGGDDESTTTADTTPAATSPTTTPTATTGQPPETQRSTRPKPKTITVEGGKPVGGVERLEYDAGERVRIVVKSDVADEVHVHGYDISRDVAAGGSVRFGFPAKLEGVFEIELEQRHEQIAELRVNP
jgi:hypothetical protein